jgi:hypothetical protein
MRVTLDEHDLAAAGGMTVAMARELLQRVLALPNFRFRDLDSLDDTANWHRITTLKYFSGSMQWVWVGPSGDRAQAPLQLPQEPLGFPTRDLAEQAGRRFGFNVARRYSDDGSMVDLVTPLPPAAHPPRPVGVCHCRGSTGGGVPNRCDLASDVDHADHQSAGVAN